MEEEWRDIEEFKGLYQVSNFGRVKSLERYSIQGHLIDEKIIKPYPNNSGYLDVSLYIDGKRYHRKIHRLVAEAFIPNPEHLNEVDHIDTDKNNNIVTNLRWVTHSENHLNPLTVQLKSKNLKGIKWPEERCEKLRKKVCVFKDGVFIHKFNSYKELDEKSKEVIGIKLWSIYARKVIVGEKDSYLGYTFALG